MILGHIVIQCCCYCRPWPYYSCFQVILAPIVIVIDLAIYLVVSKLFLSIIVIINVAVTVVFCRTVIAVVVCFFLVASIASLLVDGRDVFCQQRP